MRTLGLTFGLAFGLILTAAPALAETIRPADARAHIGQMVTVEGVVSNVHTITAPFGVTFIDMGGHFPDNAFTAVILAVDSGKFSNVDALNGKTVDITGQITLYKGKPEIILKDAGQLKAR